jgi:hypothetical protein
MTLFWQYLERTVQSSCRIMAQFNVMSSCASLSSMNGQTTVRAGNKLVTAEAGARFSTGSARGLEEFVRKRVQTPEFRQQMKAGIRCVPI